MVFATSTQLNLDITKLHSNDKLDALILFLGNIGCGKTKHSTLISNELGSRRISTGDLLRQRGDQPQLDNGKFAPSDLVLSLIIEELSQEQNPQETPTTNSVVVMEGYPRNCDQVQKLLEILNFNFNRLIIFELVCPETEIKNRLARRYAKDGRPDDRSEVVLERINTFNSVTLPGTRELKDSLFSISKSDLKFAWHIINTTQPVNAVAADIETKTITFLAEK